MKLLFTIFLFGVLLPAYSLGLADFVPGFLQPVPVANRDESSPVKPFVDNKRSTSDNSWYCNRVQSNGGSSVFCRDSSGEVVANSESVIYSNAASTNTRQAVQPNSNQYALQSQQTRAVLSNSNNFSVPIQPSQDVNVSVGQQQVEVNIKY